MRSEGVGEEYYGVTWNWIGLCEVSDGEVGRVWDGGWWW